MDMVAGGSIISSQDILTQYILSRYINMCGGSLYAVANSLNQALGKHWKYPNKGFRPLEGYSSPFLYVLFRSQFSKLEIRMQGIIQLSVCYFPLQVNPNKSSQNNTTFVFESSSSQFHPQSKSKKILGKNLRKKSCKKSWKEILIFSRVLASSPYQITLGWPPSHRRQYEYIVQYINTKVPFQIKRFKHT